MSNKPTLSVVLSNYNHGRYLKGTLEAIVSQSFKPIEFIIIDDASTDDSVSIIESFAANYSFIRFIRNQTNKGCIYNQNFILPQIKGDYLYWATSDDMVLPGFFEKSLNLLERYPDAGLCSVLTLLIDQDIKSKGLWPLPIISFRECYVNPEKAFSITYNNLLWMHGVSVILKRKHMIELGGINRELHFLSDAFIYHYIALKYGTCFIPEPLVAMRRLDGAYSDTRDKLELTKKSINNFAKSMKEFPDIFSAKYIEKCRNIEMITCYWHRWFFLSNNWLSELSNFRKKNDYLSLFFLVVVKVVLFCLNLSVLLYIFGVYRNIFFNLVRAKLRHYLMVPFISINLPPNIKK